MTAIASYWTPTITFTPTSTSTLTATATNTTTPSLTPTITKTPTSTPDITALGQPEKPFPARSAKPIYNEKDFTIIQKTIHDRLVTIAWENSANIPEGKQKEISYFYFRTFINWWEIFQGFPYDSYTVVFKKNGNNRGETGVGYEATASEYAMKLDGGLKERITHEVLHAWIGAAVCDIQERKFDDGLWFREGITQYYGDRGAGEDGYEIWMIEHYQIYLGIVGTQYDIPIFDMPAKGKEMGESFSGNNRHYRINVYWKGALIAYLMDKKLMEQNLSLDDYLKYLYDKYSLKQRCFTTTNALQALNEISGEDWTSFFNDYIFGTKKLPLDGNFEFLDH